MDESPIPESFELFPYRQLRLNHSRRQLFDLFSLELQVIEGREANGSAYKLAKLGLLAEEQLKFVRPKMIPGIKITVREGIVYGCPPGETAARALFTHHPVTTTLFNDMNGLNTLSEIADNLAILRGSDRAFSFAFTRGLFLHLVEKRVCIPHGSSR